MASPRLKTQFKIVGTLHLVMAAWNCLMGAFVLRQRSMFLELTQLSPDFQEAFREIRAQNELIYGILGTLAALSVASSLITGIGMLRRQGHGWCIAGSVLNCLWIPLGTALGAWSLVILFSEEAQAEFGRVSGHNDDLISARH